MWAVLTTASSLPAAELAPRTYGSFATAWQVKLCCEVPSFSGDGGSGGPPRSTLGRPPSPARLGVPGRTGRRPVSLRHCRVHVASCGAPRRSREARPRSNELRCGAPGRDERGAEVPCNTGAARGLEARPGSGVHGDAEDAGPRRDEHPDRGRLYRRGARAATARVGAGTRLRTVNRRLSGRTSRWLRAEAVARRKPAWKRPEARRAAVCESGWDVRSRGPLRILAVLSEGEARWAILDHLGVPITAPVPRAHGPPGGLSSGRPGATETFLRATVRVLSGAIQPADSACR